MPFRLLCREFGVGLCYSEMISSHGLVHGQVNTISLLKTCEQDRPVAMQLFGADPTIMAEAARILQEYPIDLIDINMGCPVRKVVRKGAGAALMKDRKLAARIIKQVVGVSRFPVTVKIRAGWNHEQKNAREFAKMTEDCGVAAIAVHGRTWSDGFSGKVDYDVIAAVKKGVSIPVIGNGDIHFHEDGLRMISETGCDAVMIGRAALGAPWIFDASLCAPGLHERLAVAERHIDLVLSHFKDYPFARMKNHCSRYFKAVQGGAVIRSKLFALKSYEELRHFLRSLRFLPLHVFP